MLANEIRLNFLHKAKDEDDGIIQAFEETKHNRKSSQIILSRKYSRKLQGFKNTDIDAEKE